MEGERRLCDARRKLWSEVRELSLGMNGEIERLEGAPSPLRFLRDFVLPNKPCIIANAIDHWPALVSWTNAYLIDLLRDETVSVHFTPDGRADSPVHLGRISSLYDCAVVPCSSSDAKGQQEPRGNADSIDLSASPTREISLNHDLVSEKQQPGTRDDGLVFEKEHNNSRYCNGLPSDRKQQLGCGGLASEMKLMEDGKFQVHSRHFDLELHVEDAGQHASNYDHCDGAVREIGREGRAAEKHTILASSDTGCFRESDTVKSVFHDPASGAYGEADGLSHLTDSAGHYASDTDAERINGFVTQTDDALVQTCNNNTTDESWFAIAHIERLPFPEALNLIIDSRHGVAYAQQQNGCFLSEYSKLANDAEVHLPWATEALGCMPEAVNLWIGTEKSITSFHKDHYENLYAVVSGEKHFTLLPPTDVHRLYVSKYPSSYYTRHDGKFSLRQEIPLTSVPWASVDPYPPPEEASLARSRFPEYFNGPIPFTCTVHAGEILYLPSMWFHHVRQSPDLEGRTIALNFWYDMQFDIKYAYYNFLESLAHDIQAADNGENVLRD